MKRRRRSRSSSSDSDEFQKRVNAAVAEQIARLQSKGDLTGASTSNKRVNSSGNEGMKSPSDSEVYTPAVRQTIAQPSDASPVFNRTKTINQENLENLLKQIRLDTVSDEQDRSTNSKSSNHKKGKDGDSSMQEIADQAVLNAEKYKAALNMQPGKSNQNRQNIEEIDDAFFHISCHVDPAIAQKCRNGEYVDLCKLLAKAKISTSDGQKKLDIIKKEGQSYLVANEDKELRITGVRKWEQAFRIYAAIYSGANPSRAAEIWQYVHVINTAAVSYSWENVSF